ncbi:MAG TPA: isochorismatase family protein [Fimbriimonadales bacterium]|jgi:nicotinamidase-related amidase|nr:isochorismatase family protein [Fimbriimonadales bacterium]
MPLCSREDSALVVVDLQDSFLAPISDKERILRRSAFLIEIAGLLGVPILATEQYAKRMGGTTELIAGLLGSSPQIDKMCFSSCRSDEFWKAWEQTGRRQAILVGIETHICVNQTAHDFLSRGFEVFVCADATGARMDGHEIGIERIRAAGAIIPHTESVAYEWLGTAASDDFKKALEIIKRYA